MANECRQCGHGLHRYQTGNLCSSCQEKRFEEKFAGREGIVNAKVYAEIVGLDSEEQLRRLARKGVLAPRIPGVGRWQWRSKDIQAWFKQKQRAGDVFRKTAMGIASNLRTCRNDPVINLDPSYKIGASVYGMGDFGTEAIKLMGPAQLVKVDKPLALNMLGQLPRDKFPELEGIEDWGDLTYDIISDELIVGLDAYF